MSRELGSAPLSSDGSSRLRNRAGASQDVCGEPRQQHYLRAPGPLVLSRASAGCRGGACRSPAAAAVGALIGFVSRVGAFASLR